MINEHYLSMLSNKSVIRTLSEYATARGKEIGYENVFDFSLGNPSVPAPQSFTDVAISLLQTMEPLALHGYSPTLGIPEVKEKIAASLNRRFDMNYTGGHIFATSGAAGALAHALRAVTKPGDEVLVFAPYFPEYNPYINDTGARIKVVPADLETFQINFDEAEKYLTENVAAVLINSPNNPAGSCLTLETMKNIAEIAEKHDLIVISDEIYTKFSFENEFIPFRSLPGMAERTITINSFSKNFVMTGWRIGNIIAPSYIINVITQINEGVAFTAPSISQRAALHALRHRDEVQPPITEEFKRRMYYAAERINRIPNMHVIYPPKGSFYLFPSIKGTGLTSQEVADKILMEAHVLTLPGNAFGACGEGHLRLCCTVSVEKLKEAFDRIEKMEIFSK